MRRPAWAQFAPLGSSGTQVRSLPRRTVSELRLHQPPGTFSACSWPSLFPSTSSQVGSDAASLLKMRLVMNSSETPPTSREKIPPPDPMPLSPWVPQLFQLEQARFPPRPPSARLALTTAECSSSEPPEMKIAPPSPAPPPPPPFEDTKCTLFPPRPPPSAPAPPELLVHWPVELPPAPPPPPPGAVAGIPSEERRVGKRGR